MDKNWIDDIPQVSAEENGFLIAPYSEEEEKKANFQMEHNKAPELDGFPAEFYQIFWNIIKTDLMELFALLHADQLELFHINFGEIILLSKINKAERILNMKHILCSFEHLSGLKKNFHKSKVIYFGQAKTIVKVMFGCESGTLSFR
jgi:hypothetical protein